MSALKFSGEWPPLPAFAAALLLALGAFFFYRREIRSIQNPRAQWLPWLRAGAILLLVLMLSGPVLRHTKSVGTRTKLLVFTDCSQSMAVSDPELDPARKLAAARALRWLPPEGTPASERKVAAALDRLDSTTRHERMRALLLEGGQEGLLAQLSHRFEVRLFALQDSQDQLIWNTNDGTERFPSLLPQPNGSSTDLATSLLAQSGGVEQHTAILLLSDGQHNGPGSPQTLAKQFGDRGIPIFCIGFGNTLPPQDLALLGIEAPETIFLEDRVRGSLKITDDMAPGTTFQMGVRSGDRVVWEKTMLTTGRHLVNVPFDFSVKELVEAQFPALPGAAQKQTLPLEFEAFITPVAQERETRNNTARFAVRATTAKRKLLLLDGRPRWETRYIRNLFERDPQWHVNALIASSGTDSAPLERGVGNGTFPATEEALFEYDLVLLGDLPRAKLGDQELQWISNFVSKRGGGLLLLDGQRRALAEYESSPLGTSLPVRFTSSTEVANFGQPDSLQPTEPGRAMVALSLQNAEDSEAPVWSNLAPPRWLAQSTVLPGSETLLEAVRGAQRMPALVWRSFGAGRVLYAAMDETWRWRNGVGGKYQERFWSQLINAIAEPPFAAESERIALDTDAFNYNAGASAEFRVRIRDGGANPRVQAALWRDGRRVSALSLNAQKGRAGIFRGRSAPLEPGSYAFGLENVAGVQEAQLRVRFEVRPRNASELSDLTLNESLLQRMAEDSHGQYLREESAERVLDALAPIQTGKQEVTETLLWQSYWWFGAVIGLLTLEWSLRKRIGLL